MRVIIVGLSSEGGVSSMWDSMSAFIRFSDPNSSQSPTSGVNDNIIYGALMMMMIITMIIII